MPTATLQVPAGGQITPTFFKTTDVDSHTAVAAGDAIFEGRSIKLGVPKP